MWGLMFRPEVEGRSERIIVAAFTAVCRSHPWFRQFLWKELYQLIARLCPTPEWTFMNFGYDSLDHEDPVPDLRPEDETDRSFIQLYHHALMGKALKAKDVLEVRCGRGGGCSYIARYLEPRSVCGVDLSRRVVLLCRARHRLPNVSFRIGNSEALPFPDCSFDAVMNVESSHRYPSLDRFLSEARRILRRGGSFHIADLRDRDDVDPFHVSLKSSGMTVEKGGDISRNVIAAMQRDSARRIALFKSTLPRPLVR
jgi:SAM-dependent methyltransferase